MFQDSGPEVFDELVGGGEAADAEGEEDPPSGVRGPGADVLKLFFFATYKLNK